MDGERSDGGRGEAEVVDEFACAGMLRGSLSSLHSTVERIFRVTFDIGVDELSHGNNGQIWLKLRGQSDCVKAAKLFVKGVLNQEEQQEVSYPRVLHCVFCGARGLFMDCLMRSTSAHIVVGSVGFLLISGLAEPVVRAYSLVTELVERYEGTQSRRSESGDRGSGESLDSRRAFKTLVEKWDDRHTLDLLVLPGSVKEILLDLVKETGLGSDPNLALKQENPNASSHQDSLRRWDGPADRWIEGMIAGKRKDSANKDSFFQPVSTSGVSRGSAEGAEEGLASSQEVGEEDQVKSVASTGAEARDGQREEEEEEEEQKLQFLLLLKFFTAMGYTDDVVTRVLTRTGPKEASQILDLVQQEQDRSDQEQKLDHSQANHLNEAGTTLKQSEMNQPCEMEHREGDQMTELLNNNGKEGEVSNEEGGGAPGSTRLFEGDGSIDKKEEGQEEDFVLGVLKKAAASCGYMEQKVAKAYNMFPDRSTHQLLLELQRDGSSEDDVSRERHEEMDDVVLGKGRQQFGPVEDERRGEIELFIPAEKRESNDKGWVAAPKLNVPLPEPDFFTWINKPQQINAIPYMSQPKLHQPPTTQTPHQNILAEVKGPPTSTYPSSLEPTQSNKQNCQTNHWLHPPTSKQTRVAHDGVFNAKSHPSNSVKLALREPQPFPGKDSSSSKRAKDRWGVTAASSVVVTGQQRFLESLQKPFELKLTDEPGDPKLRTIIIDGSNVAMSHGLSQFFSCRGIALAVQHFWDRGHRNICALLPQWRQKSNPKATEQHYLQELQKLGMVSYTPSREVQGKRIISYDDRLMLQLAQKTDGVIVTNDNLRDLSDETPVWRDIIKKRLLQYTFVGDHFMVPDDPLGRGGPHLNDFLRSDHSTPQPGNHSFAGVSTTFPSFKSPRSQTEVLHFRDRTPGGAVDPAAGSSKIRGGTNEWEIGHQHQAGRDRSVEETASLQKQLYLVFAGQEHMVSRVLLHHPKETDVNVLSGLILEQMET